MVVAVASRSSYESWLELNGVEVSETLFLNTEYVTAPDEGVHDNRAAGAGGEELSQKVVAARVNAPGLPDAPAGIIVTPLLGGPWPMLLSALTM